MEFIDTNIVNRILLGRLVDIYELYFLILQPQYLRDFELLIDRDITEHNSYLFTAM